MKKLRIFCDNCSDHIAMLRMAPYMIAQGHQLSTNPNGCNVHLAFVRPSVGTGLPLVLRLDGIYYDSQTSYMERNASISMAHSQADAVIYQSEYSKRLIEAILPSRKKGSKWSIIYNGCEPNWIGDHIPGEHVVVSIWSKWRRHKRLKESIQLFHAFRSKVPGAQLHIFGLMHDNKPIKDPSITYHNHVDRSKMHNILRSTTLTLHLSKRDSFPNSVVEAIAGGIPVITTNNCGGSTEACNMTPGCVVVDGDGDYNDVSPVAHYGEPWNALTPELEKNLLDAMLEISSDRRRVILPKELHASYAADKYMEILSEVSL